MSERRFYRIKEACEYHTVWAKDEEEATKAMAEGLGLGLDELEHELTFTVLTREEAAALMIRDIDTNERASALELVNDEIALHGDRPMLVGSTVF